jgi:putative copper resistance protein D
VATLVATGIVNSWFLVGTWPALLGTAYGRVLHVKIALLAAMIALASINRWRLTPKLAPAEVATTQPRAAARGLCRNASLEYALGVGVLMAVGVLNVSVPAAHDSVVWPLSFTLRPAELLETGHAIGMLVGSLLLAAAGLGVVAWAVRRRSLWRAGVGFSMFAAAAASAGASMIGPAFPTTYAASPRPFDAVSIARGAQTYAKNCAACHGVDGYGDGPLAASLPVKPADLAAGHLLHHTDGDLFWWISHGISDTPMPAFASLLSPNDRWNLIEFLHAQAEAETAKRLTTSVEPWQPFVAPGFNYEIGSCSQQSLLALRGRSEVLLVLYTWPESEQRLAMVSAARPRIEAAGARIVAFPLTGDGRSGAIFADADPDVVATYSLFRRTPTEHTTPPLPAHWSFSSIARDISGRDGRSLTRGGGTTSSNSSVSSTRCAAKRRTLPPLSSPGTSTDASGYRLAPRTSARDSTQCCEGSSASCEGQPLRSRTARRLDCRFATDHFAVEAIASASVSR